MLAVGVSAALLGSGLSVLPAAPASAAASSTTAASDPVRPVDVPVSPSAALVRPPAPSGPAPGREGAGMGVFDPATSRLLPGSTTPTRQVFANADGSRTAQLATRPVRFQDPAGAWRDLDLTPVADPAGGWHGRAVPPGAARLSARARGALVTATTAAGPVSVAADGIADVPGEVSGRAVRYRRALAGADVSVSLTASGFEESVVLPDASGPAAHTLRFTVPAGVSAQQGVGGVQFTDRSGGQVALLGDGVAVDSTDSGGTGSGSVGGAESPVRSRLLSQTDRVVLVAVQVDPAWLADPARVFPVTVDPVFATQTSAGGASADTWVSTSYANTPQDASTELRVGTPDGGRSVARSYLRFDLGALAVPRVVVDEAHLRLYNSYSYSCQARRVSVYQPTGPFEPGTVWSTQPGHVDPPVSSSTFARGYSSACPGGWQDLDVTALARAWGAGSAPNDGMMLAADERDSYG